MTGLEGMEVLVDGLDHPEAVTVDADATLYAGGEAGQVYRIADGGFTEVASSGGFLLGVACDAAGRVYGCDIGRKEVVRADPSAGDVTTYSSGTAEVGMTNPNWPVFDADGNLYVTDSGTWKGSDGRIYRVDASGETTVWTWASTNFPNGACLSRDADALLVLESLTPALVRIPIRPDGSAGEREVVAELPGTVPDGIALDADGNAFVCCYRPDRIVVVSPSGTVEVFADDPEGTILGGPANGVFTGPHLETFVIANLGRWHLTVCRPGVKGHPLPIPEVAG